MGGKGLVELDDIDAVQRPALLGEQLVHRVDRAHPHDARRNAGNGSADDSGPRSQAEALDGGFASDKERRCAVVDTRRIACRDAATFAKGCGQAAQRLQAGRARMLVAIDRRGLAFPAGDRDRHDFRRQDAVGLRRQRALLAAQRKSILVATADTKFCGHVFGRLWHGVGAKFCLKQRVHEAPADRSVEHLHIARVG